MTTLKELASKMRIEVRHGASHHDEQDEWQKSAVGYTVTLRWQRRSMTLDFWMGSLLWREPTAEDVLECLVADASYDESSFEDWCADLGYDSDSRKAERIYKKIQKQTKDFRRLLGADFDMFMNAERN